MTKAKVLNKRRKSLERWERAVENMSAFEIVGLPDLAVKEAKERVRTACQNSGYPFPYSRITVNLAPADRKKEGSAFDLAILLAILKGARLLPKNFSCEDKCFFGEF